MENEYILALVAGVILFAFLIGRHGVASPLPPSGRKPPPVPGYVPAAAGTPAPGVGTTLSTSPKGWRGFLSGSTKPLRSFAVWLWGRSSGGAIVWVVLGFGLSLAVLSWVFPEWSDTIFWTNQRWKFWFAIAIAITVMSILGSRTGKTKTEFGHAVTFAGWIALAILFGYKGAQEYFPEWFQETSASTPKVTPYKVTGAGTVTVQPVGFRRIHPPYSINCMRWSTEEPDINDVELVIDDRWKWYSGKAPAEIRSHVDVRSMTGRPVTFHYKFIPGRCPD